MFNINGQKAYNTREVAEILEVQTQAIRKLIIRKRIPAIKPGTEYYILEEDLKEYLEKKKLCKA